MLTEEPGFETQLCQLCGSVASRRLSFRCLEADLTGLQGEAKVTHGTFEPSGYS